MISLIRNLCKIRSRQNTITGNWQHYICHFAVLVGFYRGFI